jgi:putative Ca2+/H+ antiporter (TMEM165/GDT1 family)
MSNCRLLATVFGVIFVAQLPGKSALTAFVLAARNRRSPVLAGAAVALAAHSAIAVAAGNALSVLPARPIHVGAGLLFVVSAAFMWRQAAGETVDNPVHAGEERPAWARVFGSAFALIFVAEWGDLTQLGTAALAARYGKPFLVFLGATLGLWTATSIAVLMGRVVGHVFPPERARKLAAAIFAVFGVAVIAGIV